MKLNVFSRPPTPPLHMPRVLSSFPRLTARCQSSPTCTTVPKAEVLLKSFDDHATRLRAQKSTHHLAGPVVYALQPPLLRLAGQTCEGSHIGDEIAKGLLACWRYATNMSLHEAKTVGYAYVFLLIPCSNGGARRAALGPIKALIQAQTRGPLYKPRTGRGTPHNGG